MQGWSAVHRAVYSGDAHEVARIIKRDPRQAEAVGHASSKTPLMLAATQGHDEVARVLLDHGVRIDRCDSDEDTALWISCLYGHAPMVSLLLSRGADVTLSSHVGRTPLMVASDFAREECVRELLLHGGSELDAADAWGRTPMWHAAASGHGQVVKMLIAAGADPTTAPLDETDAECKEAIEEWERVYSINKARCLHDATHVVRAPALLSPLRLPCTTASMTNDRTSDTYASRQHTGINTATTSSLHPHTRAHAHTHTHTHTSGCPVVVHRQKPRTPSSVFPACIEHRLATGEALPAVHVDLDVSASSPCGSSLASSASWSSSSSLTLGAGAIGATAADEEHVTHASSLPPPSTAIRTLTAAMSTSSPSAAAAETHTRTPSPLSSGTHTTAATQTSTTPSSSSLLCDEHRQAVEGVGEGDRSRECEMDDPAMDDGGRKRAVDGKEGGERVVDGAGVVMRASKRRRRTEGEGEGGQRDRRGKVGFGGAVARYVLSELKAELFDELLSVMDKVTSRAQTVTHTAVG